MVNVNVADARGSLLVDNSSLGDWVVDKRKLPDGIEGLLRERPIVQFGDIYRLLSPYDNKGLASLMYVTQQKDKAVFYWWKTEQFQNEHLPRIKMAGLDPTKSYRIHELNRIDLQPLAFEGQTFTGAYLMNHGLEIPYTHNVDWGKKVNWSSRVLLLEAQ